MKYLRIVLILLATGITLQPVFSQTTSKPVYVIVHGAYGGGWAFEKVDSLLTKTGSVVYRPTLTGLGERVHLASKDIGLQTHINDIVNTILFEELFNVILVGHSYGGMVVTGVVDSIPERISKLVYVDATLPENNENILLYKIPNDSIREAVLKRFQEGGKRTEEEIKQNYPVNGFLIPWVPEGKIPPMNVPHPAKTFIDTISLNNPDRLKIPTTYILLYNKGTDPDKDGAAFFAERADKKGWPVIKLESDHNIQWSAPEEFVDILKEIENK